MTKKYNLDELSSGIGNLMKGKGLSGLGKVTDPKKLKKLKREIEQMKARLKKEDTGINIAKKMMQFIDMRHFAEEVAELETITPEKLVSILSADNEYDALSLFLDEASEEGKVRIIKTKDNKFQVQRMTKDKFVDQGKPYKSLKQAEKERSTGQSSMQFESEISWEFDGVMVRISPSDFDKLSEDLKDGTDHIIIEGKSVPVLFVAEVRQMKDTKTEVMVQKNGKVKVIDKKDEKRFLGMGYTLAECMELQIEAASPEKIMKDIASLEKMISKIGGNSSAVKMKKVALERKIAKLEAELEDMDEATQESYGNYKKKLKEYGYGPAKKKMKPAMNELTAGQKKLPPKLRAAIAKKEGSVTKEAMEGDMPAGEHVFDKEVDGKTVMVHKLEKTGKFCAYVDGDKIGEYDDLESAKTAAMDSLDETYGKKKMKDEELSPKQKKIDKNKNGKIDGSDLQSLRKEDDDFVEAKMTWKDWEREGNDAWQSREKRKDNPYKKKGQSRTSWFDGWDNMQKDSDNGDFDESYGKMNASKMSSKDKAKTRALSKADKDAQPKDKVSLKKAPWDKKDESLIAGYVDQMNKIVEGGEIEPSIEESMNPAQLEKLKAGYESLRGKRISAENGLKISRTLEKLDKKSLINLLNADIPFVSTLAVNKLMMNHGMSPADIKNSRGAE